MGMCAKFEKCPSMSPRLRRMRRRWLHCGPPTGHVFRVERRRGPQWYAKFRLPDDRQVQRRIGPAWTEHGRPAAGYFTKRLAEDWLRRTLDEARRGTLPGMVRSGATFADAAAEYLRYVAEDRGRRTSTVGDYRSIIQVHLLPAFGETPLEDNAEPASLPLTSQQLLNERAVEHLAASADVLAEDVAPREQAHGGLRRGQQPVDGGPGATVSRARLPVAIKPNNHLPKITGAPANKSSTTRSGRITTRNSPGADMASGAPARTGPPDCV
jgi:hypothetical protein